MKRTTVRLHRRLRATPNPPRTHCYRHRGRERGNAPGPAASSTQRRPPPARRRRVTQRPRRAPPAERRGEPAHLHGDSRDKGGLTETRRGATAVKRPALGPAGAGGGGRPGEARLGPRGGGRSLAAKGNEPDTCPRPAAPGPAPARRDGDTSSMRPA